MKRFYFIVVSFIIASTCVLAQEIDISGTGAIVNAAAGQNDTTASANSAAKPLNDASAELNDASAQPTTQKPEKKPNKALLFFYRTGNWVDNYLQRGIDTSYIGLPEHSWRVAYTNGMVGVHSTITSYIDRPDLNMPSIALFNQTTPSVDLGFNVGYRGFGFGYSWDAINAYAQRLSFSLGSKFIGLDFSIHTSTNIQTSGLVTSGTYTQPMPNIAQNNVTITNANLDIWYALNARHYSHQAAVKQSYIQKKTAGSLLLHLAYMSSQVQFDESFRKSDMPFLPALMSGLTALRTRQIAIGIGYGINYTPNKGKVVLHASAAAMLVTYSVNLASYYMPDSIVTEFPSQAMFNMEPSSPVHVTGNMRAAVSWEINKWVHLNAWATADHIRFKSKWTQNDNYITLKNWNWKVQVAVGVRFGAGKDRLQRALYGMMQASLPMMLLRSLMMDRKKAGYPNGSPTFSGARKIRLPNILFFYFTLPSHAG